MGVYEDPKIVVHKEQWTQPVEGDVDGQVGHIADNNQQRVEAVADAGVRQGPQYPPSCRQLSFYVLVSPSHVEVQGEDGRCDKRPVHPDRQQRVDVVIRNLSVQQPGSHDTHGKGCREANYDPLGFEVPAEKAPQELQLCAGHWGPPRLLVFSKT